MVLSELPNYRLRVNRDIVHEVKHTTFDQSDVTVCGVETEKLFDKTFGSPPWHNIEVTRAKVTCLLCIAEAT